MEEIYCIAIGAGSGGLEEINSFFDYTSPNGASYVVIHHFSNDHNCTLAELISRHSKMPVWEAVNLMKLEAGVVYVLSNDHLVSVEDQFFHFIDSEDAHLPARPIDHFFNSLATGYGGKAIGIILSGSGTDGASGLKKIRATGGTAIVRNPKTTAYSEMPEHASEAGIANHILEPELMPVTIEEIINGAVSNIHGS